LRKPYHKPELTSYERADLGYYSASNANATCQVDCAGNICDLVDTCDVSGACTSCDVGSATCGVPVDCPDPGVPC
jgi:hypothetical protein